MADDTDGRRIINLLLLAVPFAVVIIFALFLLNLLQVLLRFRLAAFHTALRSHGRRIGRDRALGARSQSGGTGGLGFFILRGTFFVMTLSKFLGPSGPAQGNTGDVTGGWVEGTIRSARTTGGTRATKHVLENGLLRDA
jgi:hypothetical protein